MAAVFQDIRFHPPGLRGGNGAEVGFDGGVSLTAHQTFAGALVEGYLDVWRKVIEGFCEVFFKKSF